MDSLPNSITCVSDSLDCITENTSCVFPNEEIANNTINIESFFDEPNLPRNIDVNNNIDELLMAWNLEYLLPNFRSK